MWSLSMDCQLDNDVPKSNKHLGHLILECLKKRPEAICQIDAATGEEETNASVLSRSVRLARSLRALGLRPGEVLSLSGRNHLDLHIAFYAALLNGLTVTGVDPLFKYDEIKVALKLSRPNIAFCDRENYDVYSQVVRDLALATRVVTFGSEETGMTQFVETYDTRGPEEDYTPEEFEQDKVYAFLISTSGTTGKAKLAAFKHDVMIAKINVYIKRTRLSNENKMTLNLASVNWLTGFLNAIVLPLIRHTKLQTSNPDSVDHIIDIINKYKPMTAVITPTLTSSLLSRKDDVDLTSIRSLTITGSKIHADVLAAFRKLLNKDAVAIEAYGMTEIIGTCFFPNLGGPAGCCGRPMPSYEVKLVDPESGMEITEPNTPGELWTKGLMFSEYYNDPEETARSLSEDGFYKSGDLMYRAENENYFYVERLKALIISKNYHILPAELEDVIRSHPAVRAVCVCGVPHVADGHRPLACVVTREGCRVTEQEIKDLVSSKLSKNKELSGGVLFLDNLPMTSTEKIARWKLQRLILEKVNGHYKQ